MFILEYASIPIYFIADVAEFELHDISSERASLVGEYVADLSKFFVETGGRHLGRSVPLLTVHQRIVLHEVRLHHLHHLDRHNKRNGDQSVQQEEIPEESLSETCTQRV